MCQTIASLFKGKEVSLASIFQCYGTSYQQRHRLSRQAYKVMRAISLCRTAKLGGHLSQCSQCGDIKPHYNSCRNRHCPQCQSMAKANWLKDRMDELLPVPYFHVVFTLPHELNTIANSNSALLYNLLFQCAWETIKTLGKDPKRLDGDMGMLSILHTWGQNLSKHIHVHCVVPGGAFNEANYHWHKSRANYLFPVKVMSTMFRGLYVKKLRACYEEGQLEFHGQSKLYNEKKYFCELLDTLMSKSWVVYSKKPFAGPEQVLSYLSRYTHKIAISNHRILSCENNKVCFKWRDYRDSNKEKIMTLSIDDFISRFLQHVLPAQFMRIRQFGFLANCVRTKKLNSIRQCLHVSNNEIECTKGSLAKIMVKLTGKDINKCQCCGEGTLRIIREVPRPTDTREYKYWDTS